MKYALIILVLIIAIPAPSFARWAYVPLVDLVQESDIIVVGALGDVREYSDRGTDYGNGTIQVEEVIWGNVKEGQNLALLWTNGTGVVCPRVEHKNKENQKGIWLLTLDENGNVRADYPGRFVDLEERDNVASALMKRPVRLKVSKYRISPDEPIEVSLIFRNSTKQRRVYSGMAYRNGYLYADSKIKLELLRGWGEDGENVAALANKIIVSQDVVPIIVEPGQEYTVTFNLRDFFIFPGHTALAGEKSYTFKLSAKEIVELNHIDFYQKSASENE